MCEKSTLISAWSMAMLLICGMAVSCSQHTRHVVEPSQQTNYGLNSPKHIMLTVKDFADELGLEEGAPGRWRLVNRENRTSIFATEGDRISWTAGDDFALQFQFPEKLAGNLFRVTEGDDSIFTQKFSFVLERGETLTVEVQHPNPRSMQHLYELQYSVYHREGKTFVETQSPPRIIFMFEK